MPSIREQEKMYTVPNDIEGKPSGDQKFPVKPTFTHDTVRKLLSRVCVTGPYPAGRGEEKKRKTVVVVVERKKERNVARRRREKQGDISRYSLQLNEG